MDAGAGVPAGGDGGPVLSMVRESQESWCRARPPACVRVAVRAPWVAARETTRQESYRGLVASGLVSRRPRSKSGGAFMPIGVLREVNGPVTQTEHAPPELWTMNWPGSNSILTAHAAGVLL